MIHQGTTSRSEQSSSEASQLPLIAIALALLSIVLGATVIWGFLALPLGIAATIIALLVRKRSRLKDEAMPQLALLALILGPIGAALSVLVVVLLLFVGPLLSNTVASSTSPIQKSIQSDIQQINADETKRIQQASQFQKQFQADISLINDDLSKRLAVIGTAGTQTAKDLSSLHDSTTLLEKSLREDLSSVHGTTDALSLALTDIDKRVTELTTKVNALCAKNPGSC